VYYLDWNISIRERGVHESPGFIEPQ